MISSDIKATLTHFIDSLAILFGISNGVDYLSFKLKGHTLIFSKLFASDIHYIFQEFIFYMGGSLTIAWLIFRLLTQYHSYKKAKKNRE